MKKIKLLLLALLMSLSLGGFVAPVYAAETSQASVCEGIGALGPSEDCAEDPSGLTVGKLVRTIVRLLSYAVGAISVIMILIGSFKYMTSKGESASIKSAKDTIMYALIGIVIAVLAQLLVRFVLTQATTDPAPTAPTACVPGPENGFSCPN